jgi:hypothetical protein
VGAAAGTSGRRSTRHRWRPCLRLTVTGRTPMIRSLESGVIPTLIDCARISLDDDPIPARGPRAFRSVGYLACPLNDP